MAEINMSLEQLLVPGERAAKPTDTIHAILVGSELQATALRDLIAERKYQDSLWGPAIDRDTMTDNLWLKLIHDYGSGLGRAKDYDFRTRMIKVAALAVAAIEATDGKATRNDCS